MNPPANCLVRPSSGCAFVGDHREKIQQVVLGADAQVGRELSRTFFRQILLNEPACSLRSDSIEVLASNAFERVERIPASRRLGELQINGRSCATWPRECVLAKVEFNSGTQQSHSLLIREIGEGLAWMHLIHSF